MKQKTAYTEYLKKVETLDDYPKIEGYNFEEEFNFDRFIKSYQTTGLQASNLASAIEIVRIMRREKATIFLSCTSNLLTSGLRETVKFLVKNKFLNVLAVSAGGVEEDIIKCFKPFVLGSFEVSGEQLFERGIARAGNVFIPNDRYLYFEKELQPFFEKIYEKQKKLGRAIEVHEFIKELGLFVNDESSVLYWCAKNDIPVFCPAIMDGALGDLLYFFKQKNPDFQLDVVGDTKKIVDITLNCEKSGVILLGGGVAKHYILNANIFREGADYAVYVNTAQEFDGSDSGARIEEAITWGKVKPRVPAVKVHADASIAFPLIVASTFAKEYHDKRKT